MYKTEVIAARAFIQTKYPDFSFPDQSYLIFMIPRTGSNLLTTHLQHIKFGNPIESFHPNQKLIRKNYDWDIDFDDTPTFMRKVLEFGTTNGVFGIKMNWYQLQTFVELARQLTAAQYPSLSEKDLIDVFFPNARFLYMKRRNKVKQAVSFSKGKQTGIWAVKVDQGEAYKDYVLPAVYNQAHIESCLEELLAFDTAWENFLTQNGIKYLTVWYEDLAKNFVQEMSRIYAFLNAGREEVPAPVVQKLANARSQEWVSQFEAETTWLKDPIIAESLAAGDFRTAYIHRSMRLITEKEELAWKAMPSNRFKSVRKLMLRIRRKLNSLLKK